MNKLLNLLIGLALVAFWSIETTAKVIIVTVNGGRVVLNDPTGSKDSFVVNEYI